MQKCWLPRTEPEKVHFSNEFGTQFECAKLKLHILHASCVGTSNLHRHSAYRSINANKFHSQSYVGSISVVPVGSRNSI